MSARYSLQLLGTPRLREGTAERHLPSRRALALLAILAVDGRATRGRIASLFWGEVDEASARRNLRRELARLRDAGLGDTFDAAEDTLALGAAVEADLAAFVAAADAGDAAAALAHWQGGLLDGFGIADAPAFDAWLAQRRETLARRWRDAAAEAAAQHEARGDARAALDWHLRLVADDPLQERHHADTMRLHFLLGDRSAALEAYERCRTLLRDELGLEPLAATVALAERIRAAERLAPLAARRVDASLRRLDAPLIGRDAEAARLRDSRSAVLLLQGEPGVGKTRLAQEALLARRTLSMRCEAVARNAALHPVAEAVRAALDEPGRLERLETLAADDRREAARLVPALQPQAQFEPAAGSGDADRQRLFDALGELLDRLAGPGGTVWIDDLHWADDMTLGLVAHLAHRRGRRPEAHVRVVAAARTQELDDHAAARDTLRALERARLLERLPLAPFAEDETLALVRALSGSAGGTLFSARLQRATRGNPFFLLETIRFLFDAGELKLDDRGAWATHYDDATTDYAELPVPPTVAATVVERVERLGAAARRVLEAAALTSAGFTLAQVQPATALSEWEALEGLERAVQAEVIAEFAPGWRFVHDLAREALAAQLGADRRRLIHDRLARTLIAQHARADLVALHLEGAGRPADALPWRIEAAREAERLFAWRDALVHHERALALGPSPAQAIEIRRARIAVLRTLHDLNALRDELDALEALVPRTGGERLALEVIAERIALGVRQHRYADAIEQARRAWAHPAFADAPAALQQAVTRDGAFALVENGQYDEARAIYERELARAAELSPGYLGALHHGMANYHTSFGDDELAAVHLRRAIPLLAAAGEDERRLRSLNILAYCQHHTFDVHGAIETMQQALDEAERLRHVSLLRSTLLNFTLYVLEVGEVERAARQLARAQQLLEHVDDPATQCRLQIRISELAEHRGDLGAALQAARRAVALIEANGGGLPDFWPWFILGRLLWSMGDRDGAAQVYLGLPQSPAWLPTAGVAVRFFPAAWRLPAEADAALALFDEIEPAAGVLVDALVRDFFRGVALHQLGRDREALPLLEPAVAPRHSFVLRRADKLVMRLRVRAALGLPTAAVVDQALALLPTLAPLAALALRRALAFVFEAGGDAAAAAAQRAAVRAAVPALAASLAGEPALRACFEAEFGA